MSFKVLIIPEDPIYNGFILQPLGERVMKEVGKNNANVLVLTDPKLAGFEHAKPQLEKICSRYRHFDLILFLPDRDGKEGRDNSLKEITERLQSKSFPFIALSAKEEVETWLLAGHKGKLNAQWSNVRNNPNVKEDTFEPFLSEYGDDGPGEGRERLMKETLRNFSGLMQSCPEIQSLVNQIRDIIVGN